MGEEHWAHCNTEFANQLLKYLDSILKNDKTLLISLVEIIFSGRHKGVNLKQSNVGFHQEVRITLWSTLNLILLVKHSDKIPSIFQLVRCLECSVELLKHLIIRVAKLHRILQINSRWWGFWNSRFSFYIERWAILILHIFIIFPYKRRLLLVSI